MFQTEPIVFLQSLETDVLNSFFIFWTTIGYSRWMVPIVLLVLFGVSFQAGFIMMQAMLWTIITTFFLKDVLALPRPSDVDVNVKLIGVTVPNTTPFDSSGAETFFGGLPQDVVWALRTNPISSWGFPSGHTSNAVTFGGLLLLLFRKPWVSVIAVSIIVFIPLSRMYLGRHFLADVLGGYVIGIFFVLTFYFFVYGNRGLNQSLFKEFFRLRWNRRNILCLFYLVVLPVLLLLSPHVNRTAIATLLGFNLGFLLLWMRGIPEDTGTIIQRTARVLLAVAFYLVADTLFKGMARILFPFETELIAFIRATLTAVLILWGSTECCIKLGLYQRKRPNVVLGQ